MIQRPDLIVASPGPYGVDVPPVSLWLGVDLRVPVHLAGGGDQDAGLGPLGQTQHVHCTYLEEGVGEGEKGVGD